MMWRRSFKDRESRGLERISLHGLPGYRLTGDEVYNGGHYGLVVDMYEANSRIYEIAGMKEGDNHPLKDPDIRAYTREAAIRPNNHYGTGNSQKKHRTGNHK
jgi:hypothetical protein